MPNLFEAPWTILFCGIAVEAVLAVALLRTGRGYFLWIMIGVAVLTGGMLTVERLVVTEREAVTMTLDGIADALVANDANRALSYLDPTAGATRARARWALERLHIRSARIRNLEITVNHHTSPVTAKAHFQGLVTAEDRRKEFPYNTYSGGFTVELALHGDRWLVTSHVEEDPPGR